MARVAKLEDTALQRELEFINLRDQIRKYLARLDTHEQRRKQREGEEPAVNPVVAAVLRAKFPHANGG